MQNGIVRHFWIFATTLDKLGKYFMVFNFLGTELTAKYRKNYTTQKFSLFTVCHSITENIMVM